MVEHYTMSGVIAKSLFVVQDLMRYNIVYVGFPRCVSQQPTIYIKCLDNLSDVL